MLTTCQLAVMDFNEGISLEQATTGQGDKRFNVTFSKVAKQWSAKPIKEKKVLGYLHRMVKETIDSAAKTKCSTILLFLNCRKISLESQNLIKLLLGQKKEKTLVSGNRPGEIFFRMCIRIYIFCFKQKKTETKSKGNKRK